jgi:hypothetical protein
MTDGIGLAALLDHPDWADVALLAGPRRAEPPVRGVRAVPDVLADPAELAGQLLAVVLSAPRADWHLDALLRRADAGGAVAVLLPGTAPLQPATRGLAERIGLPVLGAPDPLAAMLAVTRLIHEPDRVVADLVTRTAATCAAAGPGTDALVADLGRLWRRFGMAAGRPPARWSPAPTAPVPTAPAPAAPGPTAPGQAAAPRPTRRAACWSGRSGRGPWAPGWRPRCRPECRPRSPRSPPRWGWRRSRSPSGWPSSG